MNVQNTSIFTSGSSVRPQKRKQSNLVGPSQNVDFPLFAPLMTPCWFQRIWKFAHEASITIWQEPPEESYLKRENDRFFMNVVTALGFGGGQAQSGKPVS